jgi:hypothetical protein
MQLLGLLLLLLLLWGMLLLQLRLRRIQRLVLLLVQRR